MHHNFVTTQETIDTVPASTQLHGCTISLQSALRGIVSVGKMDINVLKKKIDPFGRPV